jgi:FkbM family methyltransferase
LRHNQDLNIQVLCAAAGRKQGISKFCISQAGRASNFLRETGGRAAVDGTQYEIPVATVTLDSLIPEYSSPNFVKIDVEGAELLVLQGATRLLEEIKPTIYIEVDRANIQPVTALLLNAGYQLFSANSQKSTRAIDECCSNTLAIHRQHNP